VFSLFVSHLKSFIKTAFLSSIQGEIPHNQRSGFNEISLEGMQQSSLALVISYSNESQSWCLWRRSTRTPTHTHMAKSFSL
jgi:hypothetical protein